MDRVLIVGASGRAAAASARRAGFDPYVLDLFADADTERLATVVKLPMDEYPHGFVELAKRVPPMPWMYTGGLENYPDVVAAISQTRELWGNGPDVLKTVRNPFAVQKWLKEFGRTRPQTILPGEFADPSLRWLCKPIRGSAGLGVRFADSDDFPSQAEKPNYYLQEYLEGDSMSAVFAHGRRGWPTFVGVSRQLIGTDWLHAKPFAYAGNVMVAPNECPDPRPTAGWLTYRFPLRRVWGIDFIRYGDKFGVIEVNPRYTASVELYELATRTAALTQKEPAIPKTTFGKAVYYAPRRFVFPSSGPWDDFLARCTDVWRRPNFADIPHAGDIIEAGQPVLTIFAEADGEVACEAKLKASAAELDRLFAVG